MRVKTLAAAAGVAALTAVIAVPGISNASRLNTRTQPQVQTDTTTPATDPVVETPTTQPVETTTTTTAPVETTTTTEPAPVVTKPTAPAPAPVPVVVVPAPVVKTPPAAPAPTVDVTTDGPAPAPAPAQVTADPTPADPCHMDDYHAVQVDSLTNPGEAARAHKVDRNGNGTVCRKDIPGRGHGNTGEGSNIKDDQAR
jgi:hypothetical protein